MMRGCEADRCEAGATVDGRWCERHEPIVVPHVAGGEPIVVPLTEYAIEAPSDWADKWAQAQLLVDSRTEDLDEARNARLAVLVAMREQGMSLGDIAKVTGLTRQRIGQLLKDMP